MAIENIFQTLDTALKDFRQFLDNDAVVNNIKAALDQIKTFVPQVGEVLGTIVNLLEDLKTELAKFDLSNIDDLESVLSFAEKATDVLQATKAILPDATDTIDDVVQAVEVAGSLDELTDELRQSINESIDTIINKLK